ncbi:MAG: DUF4394 domain-containing protein [Propionibacteriales bacterium]|nr:DUF4394 domain-containing protein [Propionibacteriales bacterium]
MQHRRTTSVLARLGVAAVTAGVVFSVLTGPAQAATGNAYALDQSGKLYTFSVSDPSSATSVKISGLADEASILGIDERPATGALYALVKEPTGSLSAYTVDPSTGAASLAFALVSTTGAPVLADGAKFGVDFNPAADALRITSDAGQNLRALPSARVAAGAARVIGTTFVDGTLSYDPVTATSRAVATGINASAYTNNAVTTGGTTTLFNIDTDRTDLTVQTPPNDGTQAKVADLALGGRAVSGFDISNVGGTNVGYLATSSTSDSKVRGRKFSQLWVVDLTTGGLTSVGFFGDNKIVDIAIDTPGPA